MYTLQMITDQLKHSLISEEKIISKDFIRFIRIRSNDKLQENILYLSSSKDASCTICESAEGSYFVYKDSLAVTLNRIMEIMEYYSSWEKELRAASRRGCTLTELLDLAYPVISHPIIILDSNQWMIANTSALEHIDTSGNEDITSILRFRSSDPKKIAAFNQSFYDCYQRKDVYPIPGNIFSTNTGYAMNLFHNGQFSGILLIDSFDGSITPGKLDLFNLLGMLIREMLNDPSSGLSIGTEEPAFLHYLKDPSLSREEELIHALRVISWEDKDEKLIVFIAPSSGQSLSPNLNHAATMFNRLFGLQAAVYGDGILLFINLRLLNEVSGRKAVLQRIRQLSYCAGVCDPFIDIKQLPVMVQRSRVALLFGDQGSGAVNYFHDYYLSYFFSLIKDADKNLIRHPLLNELKHYDKLYGSSLYKTLFFYLKNERGITKTAEELKLHRSTLNHRIERIEELSQGLLDNPETRLHILLSYYLEKAEKFYSEKK